MTELKTTTSNSWTGIQAFALAAVSLLLGNVRRAADSQVVRGPGSNAGAGCFRAAAEYRAEPSSAAKFRLACCGASRTRAQGGCRHAGRSLLEQLKANPANAALLAQLGNLYYDAKQYPIAIGYNERSLKSQPNNNSVRTDLGTAYWYNGAADRATTQFNVVLSSEPNKPDTLFNLGVVKWQGKKDAQGAIAAWQKLLDANPGYENNEKVLQLIALAKSH